MAPKRWGLLENIREDPRQAEVLIKGTEYIRCEVAQAARREMITKLEDFLRRRSKIALVVRKDDIRRSPGVDGGLPAAVRRSGGRETRRIFRRRRDGRSIRSQPVAGDMSRAVTI